MLEARPFGPGGAETRIGTRQFKPRAKVCYAGGHWGMGAERITVVGRHRRTNRFITLDMDPGHLRDWRTELVHDPAITRVLADRGEYAGVEGHAPASAEAKDYANRIAAFFTMLGGAVGPLHTPPPGRLPAEMKDLALRSGPIGTWASMSPGPGEASGPSEVRFFTDRTGFLLRRGMDPRQPEHVRFAWRCVEAGVLRLRPLAPDEVAPRYVSWDAPPSGARWVEIGFGFRLVVTHTTAFEALAEPSRPGFWLSPLPLRWATYPFRLA